MKKTKLHEVITVQTKNDLIKLNARIGYHLGTGKKIDVKVVQGKAIITALPCLIFTSIFFPVLKW